MPLEIRGIRSHGARDIRGCELPRMCDVMGTKHRSSGRAVCAPVLDCLSTSRIILFIYPEYKPFAEYRSYLHFEVHRFSILS